MPFIAMNKESGQRVDITGYADPRGDLYAYDLVCPVCSSPMVVVAGAIRIAHFRHKNVEGCPFTAYSAGESEEHRAAKLFLREWLVKESGFRVPVELEYHLPEVGRIADLIQLFPNGWRVVHEVQLASITIETLQQRSDDYLAAGCDVIWYLGGKAHTPANIEWVRRFQQVDAAITTEASYEHRHIEQDATGQTQTLYEVADVPGYRVGGQASPFQNGGAGIARLGAR